MSRNGRWFDVVSYWTGVVALGVMVGLHRWGVAGALAIVLVIHACVLTRRWRAP